MLLNIYKNQLPTQGKYGKTIWQHKSIYTLILILNAVGRHNHRSIMGNKMDQSGKRLTTHRNILFIISTVLVFYEGGGWVSGRNWVVALYRVVYMM